MSTKNHAYRSFACWAVHRAWELTSSESWKEVVVIVESFLSGEVDFGMIRSLQESRRNAAGGVWSCGISRGSPIAAVQLAALATAADSAQESAEQVIHWLALAAGFRALGPPRNAQEFEAGFRVGGPLDRAHASDEAQAEMAYLEGELQRWLDRADTESGKDP